MNSLNRGKKRYSGGPGNICFDCTSFSKNRNWKHCSGLAYHYTLFLKQISVEWIIALLGASICLGLALVTTNSRLSIPTWGTWLMFAAELKEPSWSSIHSTECWCPHRLSPDTDLNDFVGCRAWKGSWCFSLTSPFHLRHIWPRLCPWIILLSGFSVMGDFSSLSYFPFLKRGTTLCSRQLTEPTGVGCPFPEHWTSWRYL